MQFLCAEQYTYCLLAILPRNWPKDEEYIPSRSIRVIKPHAASLVAAWVTSREPEVSIVFALFTEILPSVLVVK